jgi:hypothetical protein
LYVSQTLADPGEHRVLAWLSVVLVAALGSAAIVAMTVARPRERSPRGPAVTDGPSARDAAFSEHPARS